MKHVELHYLETARDAELLAAAGYPRYDLEPVRCGNCGAQAGEVLNRDGETVAWKPFVVVEWDTGVDTVCNRCLKSLDKPMKVR